MKFIFYTFISHTNILVQILNCILKQQAATAFDGLDLKYRVIFIEDATRGIDLKSINEQKNMLLNHGALMVNSRQVKHLLSLQNN